MKKIIKIATIFILTNILVFSAINSKEIKLTKIKMSFDKKEIIIRIFENESSKDFLSKLPMTLVFEDFAKTEKIAYLNKKLIIDKVSSSKETSDFCYYAPWGNLAVFYRGYGTDGGLVKLGIIESGKDKLTQIKDGTKIKLEVLED